MKKLKCFCSIVACLAMLGFVGCTEQQIVVIAQNAGLASVAAWYYGSDEMPTADQKAEVTGVVTFISESAGELAGQDELSGSYYQILQPKVDIWVSENVPVKDQLAVRLASGWILMGMDTMFAMNPSFSENHEIALKTIKAYCDGALLGLSMSPDAEVMKAVEKASKARGSWKPSSWNP